MDSCKGHANFLLVCDKKHARRMSKVTSIKLDARLVDEASKILGAMSRKEAVHLVLAEIVAIRRFKSS
jgi:Arc/MetJ family transcription regulator